MPGLIYTPGAAIAGTVAGMKRAGDDEGLPSAKKLKVTHSLRHTQPVQHIVEPIGGGFGAEGDKEFFEAQLRRSIAIQLKGAGFAGARPEVLEYMRGMVDNYMMTFLASVRKSMSSARRIETLPHDWIYALKAAGITGSSMISNQLDTGDIPAEVLVPQFAAPEHTEPPPPDLEGLLGPELSGKADKESRAYIPAHFPPFPSKHTYKATPVFQQRESDPRKIREKAAAEGIEAENSLRTLMAAQKAGLQNRKGGKRKQSQRLKESNDMWRTAMEATMKEDEEREAKEKQQRKEYLDQQVDDFELADEEPAHTSFMQSAESASQSQYKREINLDEPIQVNYGRKFWRKNARGV